MQTIREFVGHIVPDDGWYCVAAFGKKPETKGQDPLKRQVLVETLDEVEQVTQQLLAEECWNIYFGCASYATPMNRKAENVESLKSLYLDIDCGEDKPYATFDEGLEALENFIKLMGLPRPTMVCSGRGLQCYWTFFEPINRPTWLPLARALKVACAKNGLYIDTSRTSDAASVMRMPGTYNLKDEEPKRAYVLEDGQHSEYLALLSLLESYMLPEEPTTPQKRDLDEVTKNLLGNYEASFLDILTLSAKGAGCAQLLNIVMNQTTTEEPLWRAGLSVAQYCKDRKTAIHKMSRHHPDYNPQEVEEKAALTKGPYHCDTFDRLNPGVCQSCPNKGKVKSPITLTMRVARSETTTVVQKSEAIGSVIRYDIPEYPFPYFRGKNGGVFVLMKGKGPDGEIDEQEIMVYDYDLYVTNRLVDVTNGDLAQMRVHLPKDGVREFSIPLIDCVSTDKMKGQLAKHGVLVQTKQFDVLMAYLTRFIKDLQNRKAADESFTQFGWKADCKSFIVGEREITETEVKYVPVSPTIQHVADMMRKRGTLGEWQKVVNHYNKEGLEAKAMSFLIGAFGAPLMRFTELHGGMVSLVSNDSGTGKSTVLKAVNSCWGKPFELLIQPEDTSNAQVHRMGTLCNLAACIDEITNMKPDALSSYVYGATWGRGKNRLQQSANAERANTTTWQTVTLSSSNSSVIDRIQSVKADAQGETARVLEFRIPVDTSLSVFEADELFSKLNSNYGHAIEPYIQYVIQNRDKVMELINEVKSKIDASSGVSSKARFWSTLLAVGITGGLIANNLGLIDYDMARIRKWAIRHITERNKASVATTAANGSGTSYISAFINEFLPNMLIIDSNKKRNTIELGPQGVVYLLPKQKLNARYEPDTKTLYAEMGVFKQWCVQKQIHFEDLIISLDKAGCKVRTGGKRLGTGWLDTPATSCIRIEMLDSKEEFFNVATATTEVGEG
jgi:hypothetical protein